MADSDNPLFGQIDMDFPVGVDGVPLTPASLSASPKPGAPPLPLPTISSPPPPNPLISQTAAQYAAQMPAPQQVGGPSLRSQAVVDAEKAANPGVGVAPATATATPASSPSSSPLAGLNSSSRGIRNNNPGNLEANAWTSTLPGYSGTDGRFAIFKTPEQGLAALDQNLQSYGKQGINTPLAIASRWAPGGEAGNNPNSYGAAIANALHIGVNDKIDMTDPTQRSMVAGAIAQVENGRAGAGGKVAGGTGAAKSPGAAAPPTTGGPSASAAPGAAAASSGPNLQGLYTLSMLRALFPQHQFTPISYDPFAVMPKVQ